MSTENLKVTASFEDKGLKSGLNDARKELASTAVAATKLDSSLKGGAKGTNQAANALTNLGRVAQDAPFGFIGIQNNLNPLLESFQRLKAETGSTGSALKSLAGSLIGPAGLGFALSAASALFLAFGPAIKDFINNTTAAEKAQKSLNDKLGESEASVAGNLARLSALVAIAKDVSRSDNERKEALGALNKEYDGFNGKLTLANINTAEATRLINAQTAAIVRQAKIKGVEDLISKQTGENIKIQNQELDKNLSLWEQVKIAIKNQSNYSGASVDAVLKALKNREKSLKEGEAAITSYSDVLKKLLSEEAIDGTLFKEPKVKNAKKQTEKDVLTISEVLAKLGKDLDFLNAKEINLKTDESKAKITSLENAIESLVKKIGLSTKDPLVLKLFAQIQGLEKAALQKEILKITRSEQSKIVVDVDIKPNLKLANKSFAVQQLLAEIDNVQRLAAERLKGFNDIIQNTLTSGLTGVGESIANAITGDGSFGDIFKGIFASLGAGVKALGQELIKTYTLIQLVKKIGFKNPVAGIAAGIALVALGSLLQASFAKKNAFATGVRGFEGGTALVGERGPELVQLPRGSNVVPNAQTLAMRGGGAIVAEYTIRGTDLVTILKRTNEFNSRNY